MSRRSSKRLLAVALITLAASIGMTTRLLAQEAVTSAAVAPSPSVVAPEGEATSAPNAAAESGPRVTPPLERYQGSLPHRSGAESPTMSSGGGNHTIVLSTLALVLVVIIIVLLAVN